MATSEWSLWIAALSLITIILSICVPIFSGGEKVWIVSLIFSFAALIFSLYPLVSVLQLAKKENISLSIGECSSGLTSENSSVKSNLSNGEVITPSSFLLGWSPNWEIFIKAKLFGLIFGILVAIGAWRFKKYYRGKNILKVLAAQ